jgi:hypothetical protein
MAFIIFQWNFEPGIDVCHRENYNSVSAKLVQNFVLTYFESLK